jgi:kumamolisin
MEVSVVLKHHQPLPIFEPGATPISHKEFASKYGAHADHINRVRNFAEEHELKFLERGEELLRRTVTLAGTVSTMSKAFGVELNDYEHGEGSNREHVGVIQVSEEIFPFVAYVLGLDDRPVASPSCRMRTPRSDSGSLADSISYDPPEVGKMYGFPTDVNGTGQTIGILEFGGGFRPQDIKNYFTNLSLNVPTIHAVSVNGAQNRPSNAQSADRQVMLDIEIAGAVAPAAKIVVYFAPNTARGFHDALDLAIHDQINKPSVICISWGAPEISWTTSSILSFDEVAREAALLGITIAVAAGGSSDGVNESDNAHFPASSPNVLACGGTQLMGQNGIITRETVWNAKDNARVSGGGYSGMFARPPYQASIVTSSFRGVPDVAGNADPETGYNLLVDGRRLVMGGTGAVAPLWAGLVALMNEKLNRRVGFLNPILYQIAPTSCFNDITDGNDRAHSEGQRRGWREATGKGSPMALQLLASLRLKLAKE